MSAAADTFTGELPGEIRGLLIPLARERLLLPHALVAEVVNYQPPQPIEGAPDWLKGHVSWRGAMLPLVSAECLMQLPETAPGHRARIVVCTTLGQDTPVPYLGLLAQAIPRLVRITPDSLVPADADQEVTGMLGRVTIADESAVILDVDALERELVKALPG